MPDGHAPDVITLTGVRATGYHGVFDHERRDGQPFIVDAAIELAVRDVDRDDLATTVDYGDAATRIVAAIEDEPVDLIETLAERIAATLLAMAGVARVTVTVHKPQAPITVPFDDVSLTITRPDAS